MLNRNKPAKAHDFGMQPSPDVPRSTYLLQQRVHKTINAAYLVPFFCEPVYPGDHFKGNTEVVARMATPIVPVMDNCELETFFFYEPWRILWSNFEKFYTGENFVLPKINSPAGGFAALSIYDHLGIPVVGQIAGGESITITAGALRMYNDVYDKWFRDQNLVTAPALNRGDGPDASTDYALLRRCKRPDYFTQNLPWPQKGTAVSLPLGTTAPVIANEAQPYPTWNNALGTAGDHRLFFTNGVAGITWDGAAPGGGGVARWSNTSALSVGLIADLSAATSATVNAWRQAIAMQQMLEKDARGGTRFNETIWEHFKVNIEDYRVQRPEYIGGGRMMISTQPVPQTSSTDAETPQGNLAGYSQGQGTHYWRYAVKEPGYILGLVQVRCWQSYQQGLRKHWRQSTRYDMPWSTFANLGEQATLLSELYCTGADANDNTVFGYMPRYDELRHIPNQIDGLFRSTTANNIDIWHYGQEFGSAPGLNATFILDQSDAVLARSMAVGEGAAGQQILLDVLHSVTATRALPTYAIPGLLPRF